MKHNWEYKKWGDVLRIFNGKNQKAVENPVGLYPIYGSGGIMSYADDYICPENCTIIGRKGNINNPIFVPTKFWNVDTAFGLCPSELLNPRYLYYFCEIYDFERHNKATTIPSLVKNDLLKIPIPVPPLSVQEQIVGELDKINELIDDCRELLRTLDNLAQSIFYDSFGDPVTNPKGWEVKKLVNICSAISTGITYKPDNVAENGTIVLRSSNIQNSTFLLDDIVRIDMPLKPSQYVKKNDILMCSRNGSARLVGKVTLIPELKENMSWGAFMTIIRTDFYHFLFQYFRLPAFREQLTKTKTTTVNQITIGMLKNIQLPVPPLELQEKFAERIEQIEVQKKNVEETIANLQTLLDSRMDYWFN